MPKFFQDEVRDGVIKDKGQFLAKAKTLIVQNIQSRTIFTRGDLGRFVSVHPNVDESLDYLVTLQALTETRHIEWFEEPDRGQFVPKAPANLNSVWDLTSTPPSGFVSDRQVYPIAGSQQIFSCPICSGAGKVTEVCLSCNGSGRKVCNQCAGQGVVSCSSCGGSGKKVCSQCLGQRTIACSSCKGTGSTVSFGRLEGCFRCNGTGKEICSYCNGRGGERCLSCNGNGKNVCSFCRGKGGGVCFQCEGTGRVIITCSKCAGVGRLRRYQAVVCVFKPHEFNEVVSRWSLPVKLMKAAEASDVWQTSLNPNSPPDASRYPSEVQKSVNSLANQMKGLEGGDTRLVRNQMTVKTVPVAHIIFRLHGVVGNAWLLGKDFGRVYLPKVPFTFETWLRLKDWVSVGLAILSTMGFIGFLLLLHSAQTSPTSDVTIWLLISSCAVWVVSGLILLVRRIIAGLFLFAVTIVYLASLLAQK